MNLIYGFVGTGTNSIGASALSLMPGRAKSATFEDWRMALAGRRSEPGLASGAPHTGAVAMVSPSLPCAVNVAVVIPDAPLPRLEWNGVRALFHRRDEVSSDPLVTGRSTYSTSGEWNDIPSQIENFLHHSQTKQTITGVAFLVMLLMWVF